MSLFETVPPNIVQSIRAYRTIDLQAEAARLGQHFLYARFLEANTNQEVLDTIVESFYLSNYASKNCSALEECLTTLMHKSGPQIGFLIVLEHLPYTPQFDKDAREKLLDVFRDAAEFWANKKIPFRVFYSSQ